MATNNVGKNIQRTFVRWTFYFFTWLFKMLPYPAIQAITGGLLSIAYSFVGHMRQSAMHTLTVAFGKEKSEDELQKICKACFYNAGRGAIELGIAMSKPEFIKEKFSFSPHSRENLEAALKEGMGVIGISAHFGNFPLMLIYLAQMGFPTHAIIRPSRDPFIETHFQAARERLGLKTVHSYPREACVAQSLKALRDKELLVVLMDQNTGSKSGVYVDFFGQKAGTPTGPIVFAMRTGAPLLPIFTLREGEGDRHVLVIEKHFYLEQKSTDTQTIQYNVQKLTNIIEGYVRRYPTEWGWMHRRWKSRPKSPTPQAETGIHAA
ncbi:MAG: lysophospholipid acyltransferase family protein [Candidatus Omnitrophica bacterium]|nr:lysophospholipid acyltransferase family protein [Candidatus Omnitrophota bacterium]MDE2009937.1 lysophospholipid acyltransferase family protein [Candidatus Omnitrophota bacterium]MDE2232197.1 lysophospholipid acyltransferase family protein [Candidatus Omnitrophota bacterium]